MANNYKGNNNKGGKGGRSNNKGGSRYKGNNDKNGFGKSRDDDASSRSTNNDPSWYKVDSQIMRDAARVSFNNPLGTDINNIIDTIGGQRYQFPGLAAMWYTPAIGEATQANSPSNISAKRLIAYLRSKVSTKLSFAAADAMMYLLALDGMYSFYSYCVRLYGLHRTYMSINRYYPDLLFKSMGLKIDSTTDWNGFRSWLNRWTYKLSQLYAPASITYFARHMWMNANVYLDAPDPKAQSYIFVPKHVYKWDGASNPNGTQLVLAEIPVGSATGSPASTVGLEALQAFGDSLLEKMLQDVDIGELSGLILRAFGEGGCLKLNTINEDFMIAPVYNPEVMNQIHNATICGGIRDDVSGTITQTEYDTLAVEYKVACSANNSLRHLAKDIIIDLPMVEPTEDDIFVATRLVARGTPDADDNSFATLTTYGTELISKVYIWSATNTSMYDTSCICHGGTSIDPSKLLARTTAFNSFPIVFVGHKKSGSETTDAVDEILSSISNYTLISESELEKIHSAAALSLFSIPVVG